MGKKKRKSKLTEHQQHKLDEARRRKAYLKDVFDMLNYLGYSSVAGLMNKPILDELWITHSALARIDLTEAPIFNRETRNYIQREFYRMLKQKTVPLPDASEDEREIALSDFYEIWLPMVLTFGRESAKPSEAKVKKELCSAMKEYGVDCLRLDNDEINYYLTDVLAEMEAAYRGSLLVFVFKYNNPCMHLVWVSKMDYEVRNRRLSRDIKLASCDPIQITGAGIKGSRRQLFRVAHPSLTEYSGKLELMSAKIPRNPYVHSNPDAEYEVYIQEHAMARMFERLDGVSPTVINTYMNVNLINWDVDWYKGSLLISFILYGRKVGYFLADFTADKKIVIRTFYFITYDRTPEGEALSSYAGLQALDKKYLGIDRLSTFLASDLDKDSRFAALCREAGLGHLLDLSEFRQSVYLKDAEIKSLSDDFIEKYLSAMT